MLSKLESSIGPLLGAQAKKTKKDNFTKKLSPSAVF